MPPSPSTAGVIRLLIYDPYRAKLQQSSPIQVSLLLKTTNPLVFDYD